MDCMDFLPLVDIAELMINFSIVFNIECLWVEIRTREKVNVGAYSHIVQKNLASV